MEALVLIGGFIFLAVFGFWIMVRIDRFLDSGKFPPYWDEAEERVAAKTEKKDPAVCSSTDSPIQK